MSLVFDYSFVDKTVGKFGIEVVYPVLTNVKRLFVSVSGGNKPSLAFSVSDVVTEIFVLFKTSVNVGIMLFADPVGNGK